MKAAQWLRIQVLLSIEEWEHCLASLPQLSFFPTGRLVPQHTPPYSKKELIQRYTTYIYHLQSGTEPPRSLLSFLATIDPATLLRQEVPPSQELIKAQLPSIQVQEHALHFDPHAYVLRSMLYGKDAIPWGMQLAYPTLVEDPTTRQIVRVQDQFDNTRTFTDLRHFVRQHTLPLRVAIQGHQLRLPVRLGKGCLSWIQSCPALQSLGLVLAYGSS